MEQLNISAKFTENTKYRLQKAITSETVLRLTPLSRPNKAGLECLSVRLSTKRFFDFNEIWYVGRGRRVMHDGMQYDPIQSQGHEPLKVGNSTIFISSPIYNGAGEWPWILKLGHYTYSLSGLDYLFLP